MAATKEAISETKTVPAAGGKPTLVDPEGQFERNYNRRSFVFEHGLSGHPLFELDSIVQLARRMPDHRETYWCNGKVAVTNGWDPLMDNRRGLEETIAGIADNDSLVILKHTEQDPVFGPVLQDFLGRVIDCAGERMRSDVIVGESLILVSSPGRITPYHFDMETNFLVQVTGNKKFYVFDHTDPSMVTSEEVEGYFSGNLSSAIYRKERQGEAHAYDLRAGQGVHVPPTAPHWVQNGNNVSVAISINYELRSVARLARIHRVNWRMRNFGLRPTPPGLSPWRDQLKVATQFGVTSLKAMVGKSAPATSYGLWRPRNG